MEENMKIIFEYLKSAGKGDRLTYDADLFAGGFVSSLFALEIVLFLEETFKIRLKKKDISMENFRTIRNMAETVERLKG